MEKQINYEYWETKLGSCYLVRSEIGGVDGKDLENFDNYFDIFDIIDTFKQVITDSNRESRIKDLTWREKAVLFSIDILNCQVGLYGCEPDLILLPQYQSSLLYINAFVEDIIHHFESMDQHPNTPNTSDGESSGIQG